MSKSDWKAAERLVAAIEKSLAPDASVEHNVLLPVLGQDRKRQCDVVLRIGKIPREQLYIIEVQQRGTKPDINTFGGWLRKMDEVGANGLICVSEAGFPDSIIQDVRQRVGPKVKLITLDQDHNFFDGQPCYLVPELVKSTYKIRNIEIITFELSEPELMRSLVGETFSYNKATAFSHDGLSSSQFSISDLAQEGVQASNLTIENETTLEVSINFTATDENPLWFHTDQDVFRIQSVTLNCSVQRVDVVEPMAYSKWSYTQRFHDSTMAWAASSSFEVDGESFKMTLIFTPDAEGFLRPSLALETDSKQE